MYTKGPWILLPQEDGVEYFRIRGTLGLRYKIANVYFLNFNYAYKELHKRDLEESLANARLISAAPELLEALQNCVAFIEEASIEEAQWHWEPIEKAAKAIQKATGAPTSV